MVEELNINLEKIKVFVIVGQVKDLKVASAILHKDITNIVRNLKALERALNVKLYNRSSNKIELTDEGKIMFLDYEEAYNTIILAGKKRHQRQDINSGKLSIGISSNLDASLLNNLILEFKKKYPKVIIKIQNIDIAEIYDSLKQYHYDFIITDELKEISRVSLYEFKLDLCLAYSKKYTKDSISKISDLEGKDLIVPSSSKTERIILNNELKKANISCNIALESSDYKTSLEFAENSLGIALVPVDYLKNKKMNSLNILIKKNLFLYFIDYKISPTTELFLNELKKYYE